MNQFPFVAPCGLQMIGWVIAKNGAIYALVTKISKTMVTVRGKLDMVSGKDLQDQSGTIQQFCQTQTTSSCELWHIMDCMLCVQW